MPTDTARRALAIDILDHDRTGGFAGTTLALLDYFTDTAKATDSNFTESRASIRRHRYTALINWANENASN